MRVPKIRLDEVETFLDLAEAERTVQSWEEIDEVLPKGSFALEAGEFKMPSPLPAKGAVFFATRFESAEGLEQMYLVRNPGQTPQLCRLVRSEEEAAGKHVFRASRRKSFMTPTPLHLPSSKVSPIPDYTHAVFYLKPMDEEQLKVIPTEQSDRLLPLLSFKNEDDRPS